MNSIHRCKPLLGTYVEVNVFAEESDDTLIEMSHLAFTEIEKIEKTMSFHNAENELSKINRFAHLAPYPISTDMEVVLQQAIHLSQASDGLYDITVTPKLIEQGLLPVQTKTITHNGNWENIIIKDQHIYLEKEILLDLGGIAKGFAVDKAISIFPEKTFAIVNAGGDLRMTQWRNQKLKLRHPNLELDAYIEVPMHGPAAATSASYFFNDKSPIIHPKTKQAIYDNRSFSVFASNCMLADALTKTLYLSAESDNLLESLDTSGLIIEKSGEITFVGKYNDRILL